VAYERVKPTDTVQHIKRHAHAHAHARSVVSCAVHGINVFNQFKVTWESGGKMWVDSDLSNLSDGGRARGGVGGVKF
jgi:hypothetical protein